MNWLLAVVLVGQIIVGRPRLPLNSTTVTTAAFRSMAATTVTTTANKTLTAPSGIQNGDILVAMLVLGKTGTPQTPTALPSGWTAITTGAPASVGDGSYNVKSLYYFKVASGESGNYQWTHTSSDASGIIWCISGADTSLTPVLASTSGTGNTTTITGGVTPATDNAVILFGGMRWDNIGTTSVPLGWSIAFTEDYDNAGNNIYGAHSYADYQGATGTLVATHQSAASSPYQGCLVAVSGLTQTRTSPTYITQEEFESGVNTAPSTWSGSGSVTWNYATAPAPLVGSFSAAITGLSGTVTHTMSSAAGEIWIFFEFSYTGSLATHLKDDVCDINAAGQHCRMFLGTSGQLGLEMEALGSTSTTGGMSASTVYDVWLHCKKGAAGTETFEGGFTAHAGAKPINGSQYANCTNLGTNTTDYDSIVFTSTAGQPNITMVIDKMRVASTAIANYIP